MQMWASLVVCRYVVCCYVTCRMSQLVMSNNLHTAIQPSPTKTRHRLFGISGRLPIPRPPPRPPKSPVPKQGRSDTHTSCNPDARRSLPGVRLLSWSPGKSWVLLVASACLSCAVVRATEPGRRHLSPAPLALLLHDASAHIP